jgi:hypothetical protein
VAVDRERTTTFELGHPSAALGIQHSPGALELVEIRGKCAVVQHTEILGPKLLERGQEGAHHAEYRVGGRLRP